MHAYHSIDRRRSRRSHDRAKSWTPACARNGRTNSRRGSDDPPARRPPAVQSSDDGRIAKGESPVSLGVATHRLSGRNDRIDDAGVAGAAADMTAELLPHGAGIRAAHAQKDIARHDQHAGRTEPALQAMTRVELAAKGLDDGIVVESFQGLNRLTVADDSQPKTRASGFAVDDDGARAARSVLAPEMGGGQAAASAQEIRKRFPRLHVAGDLGTVQIDGQGLHLLCISRTARRTVDACNRAR